MSLDLPSRVPLANLPTPIQRLSRTEARVGRGPLYVKRDDETGADLSGNKVRKLEFLLRDALDQKCDIVLTCGGVQSNHCRATAVASRRLGLDSRLYLRGTKPESLDGNLFLDTMVGADVRYITAEQYEERASLLETEAERLRGDGRRPYIVPEGGSNALGSVGYVQFLIELMGQAELSPSTQDASAKSSKGGVRPAVRHVVVATGSGGTLAGLHLGRELLGLKDLRIWGVPVCNDGEYFRNKVLSIADEFAGGWDGLSRPAIASDEVRMLDGYKGPAYAVPYPEEVALIQETARTEGLLLDPVYTGKAFYGLVEEMTRGTFADDPVLFVHTGGIFSTFAYRDVLLGRDQV